MLTSKPEFSMPVFHAEVKVLLHMALLQACQRAYKKIKVNTNTTIEKRMTQEDMAAFLHITPRSYGELERGQSSFSADTLMIFLSRLSDDEILGIFHSVAQILSQYESDDWALGLHDPSPKH